MAQHRFHMRNLAWGGVLVGLLIAPALLPVERSLSFVAPAAVAQAQPPARGAAPGPVVVLPEVRPDRRVTFRILAPDAQKVELRSPGEKQREAAPVDR